MTSGHYDSDQALDLILAAGEAEELERVQAGLRLDAGLAAITRGDASEHSPCIDSDDSGVHHRIVAPRHLHTVRAENDVRQKRGGKPIPCS